MKFQLTGFIAFLVLFFSFESLGYAKRPEASARFWISEYGAVDKADNSRVLNAYDIFDRVGSATGKGIETSSNLIILSSFGKPCAFCIQDGSVILTIEGLNLCYRGVAEETGDARLAFLLGHEISHLVYDDLWHIRAYQYFQEHSFDETNKTALNILNRANSDQKELKADAYGLLYASMAGFDPKVVVNEHGMNFFKEWTNWSSDDKATEKSNKTKAKADHHPDPDTRADNLLTYMKALIADIDLFHFGKRLFQIGRYRDALSFFKAFQKTYPGREAYNNIGATHLQLSIAKLADCDASKAYQFHLASIIDSETRSIEFLPSVKRGNECLDDNQFRMQIGKAMQSFEMAIKQDPLHIPAKINLSSALILTGKYHDALGVLNDVLEIEPKHPDAINNKGIALYLLGPEIEVDMYPQSIQIFEELRVLEPGYLPALYNSGRIHWFRNRDAAAKESWKQFIEEQEKGEYSQLARSELGIRYKEHHQEPVPFGTFFDIKMLSLVDLGIIDPSEKKSLSQSGMTGKLLNLEDIFVEYYSSETSKILIIEGVVELIEIKLKDRISILEIQKQFGKENRSFEEMTGLITYVYDDFMIDVDDGFVSKVIIFDKV